MMTTYPAPSFVLNSPDHGSYSLVAPNYSSTETIPRRDQIVCLFEPIALQQATITFEELLTLWVEGSKISLHAPVMVLVSDRGDYFLAEDPTLKIFASGSSKEAALEDFGAMLIASWDGLRNEPSDRLTADALELKAKLASYLGDDT